MFHVEHSFCKILGNDLIKRSMLTAVAGGRVSHAYIISGGAGFGKTMLAHAFAKAALCFSPQGGSTCNACTSCKTYDSGNNPDVVFVSPQKASFGVDDVRDNVVADLSILPYSSSRRVYILSKAHTMTPAAQNALLKSLEDGPAHIMFILLSNGLEAFLPTILSRAITYKIPPLSQQLVYKFLVDNTIEHEKAKTAAWFCEGGLGRALKIATDKDFDLLRQNILEIAKNIESMGIVEIFATARSLEAYKDDVHDILSILKLYFRDELIQNQPRFLAKIDALDDAKEKLSRNCPFLLCMEIMLLRLAGIAL